MGFKDTVEQHPIVVIGVLMLAAFGAGIGVISFLDNRDEKLKSDIISQLTVENNSLKSNQEELKENISRLSEEIKSVVREFADQQIEFAKFKNKISDDEAAKAREELQKALKGIDKKAILNGNILGGPNSIFRKPFG